MRGRAPALGLAALLALVFAPQAGAAESAQEESGIARVTAKLLERSHFAAHTQTADLSVKYFDRYLDMLDGAHLHFLESDVAEFVPPGGPGQGRMLRDGDTTLGQRVFDRFLERLEQRVVFVKDELQRETFEFTGQDVYLLDREHAARPQNLAAARQLWHEQLRFEYLQEKLGEKKPAEIVTTLTKRYDRILRTMKRLKADQVFETYLNALVHVYDPHSDYLGRRQLEDFSIQMSLSLFGIGAVLQSEDGYCKITELLPGGPAAVSNLIKPGDRIVSVAQDGQEPVDIIEMPLTEAVPLIRGPKGSKVTLGLIPAESTDIAARQTISLVRDEIKLESQEAKARLVDRAGSGGRSQRLGIIELPSFYVGTAASNGMARAGATAHVAKLLTKLEQEHIQGLILDLRRNGGGSLEEAIQLTGLFIGSGPVVQVRDAEGRVSVSDDPDPGVLYDGPLVVLVSRLSASASEILAGALQDYGRALIVGDPATFGKGTVQTMIPLGPLLRKFGLESTEDPGALKLTIRKFYRPSGSSTQLRGVATDVVLPSGLGIAKIGEAEMPNALPWDEIAPAPYSHLDRVAPYLPALRRQSAARVARDQEFSWLRDDLGRAKKQLDLPQVSLNEKQRLQEKAAQEAREALRLRVRAQRRPAPQTQYEIAVETAEAPGLPAPMPEAVGTNAPSASATNHSRPGALGRADRPAASSAPDVVLEESKRILADYIAVLAP